jgi:multidrug efflux pump subunit AcrA (membrane-fusion protein)
MVAVLRVSDYANPKALVLPVSIVQSGTDGSYVFVMEGQGKSGKAAKRVVKIGQIYNGSIEVIDGLHTGDKVITTGYQNLIDGQSVSL